MLQTVIRLPTYNAALYPEETRQGEKAEFGPPYKPALIFEADGIKIMLGAEDAKDTDKPDVQIERQPNGWVLFIHPVGGSDPSALVYMHDDGRSFLVPEGRGGPTAEIEVLRYDERVPDFDEPDRK